MTESEAEAVFAKTVEKYKNNKEIKVELVNVIFNNIKFKKILLKNVQDEKIISSTIIVPRPYSMEIYRILQDYEEEEGDTSLLFNPEAIYKKIVGEQAPNEQFIKTPLIPSFVFPKEDEEDIPPFFL